MGAMVKDSEGNFVALTGNMVGALATDYILSQRKGAGQTARKRRGGKNHRKAQK